MLIKDATGNIGADVEVKGATGGGWDVIGADGAKHCNKATRREAVEVGERLSAAAGVGLRVQRLLLG